MTGDSTGCLDGGGDASLGLEQRRGGEQGVCLESFVSPFTHSPSWPRACSTSHNSDDVETTSMSIDGWMDKGNVVTEYYSHTREYYSSHTFHNRGRVWTLSQGPWGSTGARMISAGSSPSIHGTLVSADVMLSPQCRRRLSQWSWLQDPSGCLCLPRVFRSD